MTRAHRLGVALAVAVVGALLAGYAFLSIWSTVAIRGDFYRGIGMGSVYATRWHATAVLIAIGIVAAPILAAPLLLLARPGRLRGRRPTPAGPHPGPDADEAELDAWTARREALIEWELAGRRGRRTADVALPPGLVRIGWAAVTALLAIVLATGLAGSRDALLAARDRVPFGVHDPIFGHDVSYLVFTVPAVRSVLGTILGAIVLCLLATAVTGALAARSAVIQGELRRAQDLTARAASVLLVYLGLAFLVIAAIVWLGRYGLLNTPDSTIAGAGRAAADVNIPARGVAAVTIGLLGLGLLALALPAVRVRAAVPARVILLAAAAAWALVALALCVVATPWFAILLPIAVLLPLGVLRAVESDPEAAAATAPIWTWPALAVLTAIAVGLVGPAGAALYEAVLLKGSRLQVERRYIGDTLEATRRASGIADAARERADYRPNGVTRQAIASAPSSVASLRFLDSGPAQDACNQIEARNQFFLCDDVDVDRYAFGGTPRTVFVMGREIDYGKAPDFQRRHFVYTHGYGVVMAPVNEVDPTGRPTFEVGDIPQRGIRPALRHPEIYFGAQPDMPWAMVDTRQRPFDPASVRPEPWRGTTGIRVGSGLHRLAVTMELGGLPFVGGGRGIWNATHGRPADENSRLLLFRDIRARGHELAPFLSFDRDPYFAVSDGRTYVMLNAYAATTRYPYSAAVPTPIFPDGTTYMRAAGVLVMDAYSGETSLFASNDREPITATWRRVYPGLFRPLRELPSGLQAHLRYGEDLFDYQSRALERFHVSDVESFYNNDQAWTFTEEAVGPGVAGERIESPARYTYAVLPGERRERFLLVRSYKPATRGRGIGFSGWFAVDNDPGRFGRQTILEFPLNAATPLDSLDRFTSNVSRDPQLTQEITTRASQVRRGNTIVVPIGQGLLYTQPLYLDSPGADSLPTLWRVLVSFGDGRIYNGSSFADALEAALGGTPAGTPRPAAPANASLAELVRRAATEFDAYRQAFGAGRDDEAAQHLKRFRELLAQARRAAGSTP